MGSENNVILNSYTTKELKNKAVLSLKQFCMHSYVVLSSIMEFSYIILNEILRLFC